MNRKKSRNLAFDPIHIRVLILAFLWLTGAWMGSALAAQNAEIWSSLVFLFGKQGISFGFQLAVLTIPVLLIWILIYRKWYLAVTVICFVRMLLFGYCARAVYEAFLSAGWLVCLLVLFSQICTMMPMFWLCLAGVQEKVSPRSWAWWSTVLLFLLIALIDRLVISPFSVSLISRF